MVSASNISKKYGNLLAVNNISFELKQGEITGFLGKNGAGKSTTMKLLTGILLPDTGNITIFNHDIINSPLEAKSKIGYLSEDNPLPEDMYIKEYLNYIAGLYNLKEKKESVGEIIGKLGLEKEYKKKIHNLSKGNRQKLGLAQALIHNPDFLVLDEPTSGLDPGQQEEIKRIITEEGKSKIILFSTHLLHEVENIASRIIIIEKGEKRYDGKKEDIESVENLFYSITNENTSR